MKFKVIKDYKIIPEGVILERDKDGSYPFSKEENDIITSTKISEETIKNNKDYFEPLFKVDISESDINDTEDKNWKVVFKVKCTEKELLDVKRVIEDNLSKYT